MLWNASKLIGLVIEARDGQLGTVSDILFDDQSWGMRWLVVETGSWLQDRKVLLPLSALGTPDHSLGKLPVNLTMQQVKDSPDIDTHQSVSRQNETRIYEYYGGEPYWQSAYFLANNAMATPFVAPLPYPVPTEAEMVTMPPSTGDPHLRSVVSVTGYHIHASDGEIGHIKDFLIDDDNWHVRYMVVDTQNWWIGKKVLVAPRSVFKVNWQTQMIEVQATRQTIKDSRPYDSAVTADTATDENFLNY